MKWQGEADEQHYARTQGGPRLWIRAAEPRISVVAPRDAEGAESGNCGILRQERTKEKHM